MHARIHSSRPEPKLLALFRAIAATSMAGLAVCNPAISVEARAFVRIGPDWFGVMLLPWSLLLLRIPAECSAQACARPGEFATRELPLGEIEFLGGWLDGLGPYESASLCSPMQDFDGQGAACEFADRAAVLLGLIAPDPKAQAPRAGHPLEPRPRSDPPPAMARRRLLFGLGRAGARS